MPSDSPARPSFRCRLRLREYTTFRREVRPYLDAAAKLENTLRVGIPVSFAIRKVAGHHEFQPLRFGGAQLETDEWVRLERLGLHELGFTEESSIEQRSAEEDPAEKALLNALIEDLIKDSLLAGGGFQMEPPVLRLHRFDPTGKLPAVIRADSWSFTIPMPDKSKFPVALSWEFVRE